MYVKKHLYTQNFPKKLLEGFEMTGEFDAWKAILFCRRQKLMFFKNQIAVVLFKMIVLICTNKIYLTC